MNKTKWFRELHRTYDGIRSHQETYTYESLPLGITIEIHPDVFSPAYCGGESEWFATQIGKHVLGKSLLEVGSGTGLLATYAALQGATRIAATDINPQAVRNTKRNFERYGIAGKVVEGDVYAGLKDRFDLIIWNHPFNPEWQTDDILLRAGFDFNFEGLERYISQAVDHLTPTGRLLLGSSNYANPDQIEEIAHRHGYVLDILARQIVPLPDEKIHYELRLIELVRK